VPVSARRARTARLERREAAGRVREVYGVRLTAVLGMESNRRYLCLEGDTRTMPSVLSDLVFDEPSGRPNALVQFAGAVAFLGLYGYSRVVGNADPSDWLLVMALGATLAGVAESLPKDRHLAAGVLRLAAILVLSCLLVASVLAPEVVVG
jgi:hypothetical protein